MDGASVLLVLERVVRLDLETRLCVGLKESARKLNAIRIRDHLLPSNVSYEQCNSLRDPNIVVIAVGRVFYNFDMVPI
jgi:hypothetical protein